MYACAFPLWAEIVHIYWYVIPSSTKQLYTRTSILEKTEIFVYKAKWSKHIYIYFDQGGKQVYVYLARLGSNQMYVCYSIMG